MNIVALWLNSKSASVLSKIRNLIDICSSAMTGSFKFIEKWTKGNSIMIASTSLVKPLVNV